MVHTLNGELRMNPARFIGLVAVLSLSTTLSFAQSDPAQVVKKRQELMKSLSPNYMRGIFELRKDGTGDLATLATKAREGSEAFKTIPALFPAGTDRTAVPDTRATADVWTKNSEFDAIVAKLVSETTKFAD